MATETKKRKPQINKIDEIKIKVSTTTTMRGDTLLAFVRNNQDLELLMLDHYGRGLRDCLEQASRSGDFQGKKGQTLLFYPPVDQTYPQGQSPDLVRRSHSFLQRIILVGLGADDPDLEGWRWAGGTAAAKLLKTRASVVTLILPENSGKPAAEVAAALSEGLLLGTYSFNKYRANKTGEEDELKLSLRRIIINGPKGIGPAVSRAVALAAAVRVARDMANEPGNGWTPDDFADYGRQLARRHDLKVTVLSRENMSKLGMEGILAVSRGSIRPPRLLILEYYSVTSKTKTKASAMSRSLALGKVSQIPTLLLVGKGITFDSGGISLKPSNGMEKMKYDMCGGAAVLATMEIVGREQPQGINVVAMVPAAENLPGPAALKPGDIIRPYGGAKSVEVINTDAEGRLLLADALAYGIKKFRPTAVVDLATLTGAVTVALGHHYAGLLGNNDELCAKVLAAGERAGEPFWRLPLGPEYRKQLKSKVADLKNIDKRDAGAILGASFLQEFVGDTPWVHLDIAGTAWDFTEKPYVPKGPSGFGVRTLVELIRNFCSPEFR